MFQGANHTFVLCAYGDSSYLEECILSLLEQTVASKVSIATSTPSDYIWRIADSFNLHVNVNEGESGIAGDWNSALSCADTPLVTIAHQDDVYSNRYTEQMLESMNAARKPLLYFSDYGEIRGNEFVDNTPMNKTKRILLRPLGLRMLRGSNLVKRRVLSLGNPICCPAVTYRVDALPKPIFTSGMRSNLDWEAWERLSRLEGEFIYDKRMGMYHRIHDGSETTACIVDDTRTKEDLLMLKKFWPSSIACLINKVYGTAQRCN